MKKIKVLVISMIAVSATMNVKAQFATGADIVSSYVWRGIPQDRPIVGNPTLGSPNFQPFVSFTTSKVTLGSTASTSFQGNIKEVDLYATYAFSSAFAFTLNDYNWGFTPGISYFNYGKGTDHIYEATLNYTNTAFSASLNTMFAGADKLSNGNNAFSSYLELNYQLTPAAKVILGAALNESPNIYFTSGFGIVNVGLKVTKAIDITDKFSLPVYGILEANPYSGNIYFVAGITL
ncbi:MAG: hypothetical protein P4L34_13390 [Paludibacter sp.]|nr:hypothetical protein [Paludibacter sp.]